MGHKIAWRRSALSDCFSSSIIRRIELTSNVVNSIATVCSAKLIVASAVSIERWSFDMVLTDSI